MGTSPRTTVLAPEARSVPQARRFVRAVLAEAAVTQWADAVELAVSELVTNAVVHAGTEVEVTVQVVEVGAGAEGEPGVRLEVADRSARMPVARDHGVTAGTGRGLHLVTEVVDRWGADPRAGGKVVWCEMGVTAGSSALVEADGAVAEAAVDVLLLDVPLLMHWAWQEHAQTLLREHLLAVLEDDPRAVEDHAEASQALDVLHAQVPRPRLPVEPSALLADVAGPSLEVQELVLRVPPAVVSWFATLNRVLGTAVAEALAGRLLGPPTQPEVGEMRAWLCGEVLGQAAGEPPRSWRDFVAALALDRAPVSAEPVAAPGEAVLVSDEAGVVVAVGERLVAHLGHPSAESLVGRRMLAVVPERFHQAHVAGLTLNATHGRDVLLNRWLRVPIRRADGSEVEVGLRVSVQRAGADRRVFVADFDLD